MKTKLNRIRWMMIVVFALAISCTKDDDNNNAIDENQLENIQDRIESQQETIQNVAVPQQMQTYAQSSPAANEANFYVELLKTQALTYSSVFLGIPLNAEQQSGLEKSSGGSTVWTWTDGITTLYYTVRSDEAYDYFTYDIETEGERITFYDGKLSKDGNFYEINFYQEDYTLTLSYKKTGSLIEFVLEDSLSDKIEMVYNETDQSGSIKVYEEGNLSVTYVWNADGSGSFTDHSSGETIIWPE